MGTVDQEDIATAAKLLGQLYAELERNLREDT